MHDAIYIAHYHEKKPAVPDEDADKLDRLVGEPYRVFKETANEKSMSIFANYRYKDRYNQLGLIVRPEFSRMMEEDKYLISRSIRDYFVFPLLVEEHLGEDKGKLPREIDSLEGFIGILGIKDKIVISGGSDTGKSILAKVIYAELAKHRVVLFLNGADVGPNPERTIREAFEDTYSNDKTKFEAFKQAKPEELAIVIDDVDAIEVSREDGFISYISYY